MLIDAVIARAEEDMYRLRHALLCDLVDLIVIGESRFSFSGERKPMRFSQMAADGQLLPQTEVLEIPIPKGIRASQDRELIQNHVRVEFANMLHSRFPDATFLFQDIDEVPSRTQIFFARELNSPSVVMSIPMRMFWRRANWELQLPRGYWLSPKVFRGKPPPTNLRSYFTKERLGGEPGAHFSFLGMGPHQMIKKFKNYGHQEYNLPELWSKQLLEYCDRFGIDHLGRADRKGMGVLTHLDLASAPERAREAAAFNPAWLGADFSGNLLTRLVRAQMVSDFVRNGGDRPLFADEKARMSVTVAAIRAGARVVCVFASLEAGKFRKVLVSVVRRRARFLRACLRKYRKPPTDYLNKV